jgi:hypothetical protein
MRYASVIFATALAGVFANASAKADVFDFNFGPEASGTFATGAPATFQGFDLITRLTFGVLSGQTDDGKKFAFNDVVGSDFAAGAAFDPTFGEFVSQHNGQIFDNIGDFLLLPIPVSIDGPSFEQESSGLSGVIQDSSFHIGVALAISLPGPTPVPEASTWAMILLGFAGLGFAGYRAKRATRRASRGPKYVASVTS